METGLTKSEIVGQKKLRIIFAIILKRSSLFFLYPCLKVRRHHKGLFHCKESSKTAALSNNGTLSSAHAEHSFLPELQAKVLYPSSGYRHCASVFADNLIDTLAIVDRA